MNRWEESSWRSIRKVVDEHGIDNPELRKIISASYPFAWRSGYAYKCWLNVVNAFFVLKDGGQEHFPPAYTNRVSEQAGLPI